VDIVERDDERPLRGECLHPRDVRRHRIHGLPVAIVLIEVQQAREPIRTPWR